MSGTNPYDRTKNYTEIIIDDNQEGWSKDINHLSSLLRDQGELTSKSLAGWNLVLRDDSGDLYSYNTANLLPIVDIRPTKSLRLNGIVHFEVVSPTTFKWRYNTGAWSGAISITADGTTWNQNPGNCGFDIIFATGIASPDACSLVAVDALRGYGGDLEYIGTPNALTLRESVWLIRGRWITLPETTVASVIDGDIVYLEISVSTEDKDTDTALGHYLGDGRYHPRSPEATKWTIALRRTLEVMLPDDSDSVIIVPISQASVTGPGVVTPEPYWEAPISLQKLLRDSSALWAGDAPPVPTGLTALTGGSFSGPAIKGLSARSFISAFCTEAIGGNTAGYEFRFVFDRLSLPYKQVVTEYVRYEVGDDPYAAVRDIQSGRNVRINVRAIGYNGKASAWSSNLDQVAGGTCRVTVAAPTFTLVKTEGGFFVTNLTYSAPQTNALGVTIRVREGTTPGTTDTYFNRNFLFRGTTGEDPQLFVGWIPTTFAPDIYVTVEPFDDSGILLGSTSSGIINLSDCLIPASNTGPVTVASIYMEGFATLAVSNVDGNTKTLRVFTSAGGPPSLIDEEFVMEVPYDGIGTWTGRIPLPPTGSDWGISVIGVDRFGVPQVNDQPHSFGLDTYLENIYVVAKTGTLLNTVQGAINKVHANTFDRAEIHIMPGVYTEDISFPSGLDCKLVLRGFGNAIIDGDADFSNVSYTPAAAAIDPSEWVESDYNLRCYDITFQGTSTRADQAASSSRSWTILFDCCQFDFEHGTATTPLIEFNQHAPGPDTRLVLHFRHCKLVDLTSKVRMIYFRDGSGASTDIDWVFDDCIIIGNASSSLITVESNAVDSEVHCWFNTKLLNIHATGLLVTIPAGNVVMVGNAFYVASGNLWNGGTTPKLGQTIAGVGTDTNVEYLFPFLRTDA